MKKKNETSGCKLKQNKANAKTKVKEKEKFNHTSTIFVGISNGNVSDMAWNEFHEFINLTDACTAHIVLRICFPRNLSCVHLKA